LNNGNKWKDRIGGVRANASTKSHAELDQSDQLDPGDRQQLAQDYRVLRTLLPNLKIFGGCCGTDYNHLDEICNLLVPRSRKLTG